MKDQLSQKGDKVTLDELKEIASYKENPIPEINYMGNIYNQHTVQIAIFEPEAQNLEVYFRGKEDTIYTRPNFEKINVNF